MELLAPAGNYEKFLTALHFGADAMYLASRSFGLRAFAGNFSDEEIKKAVILAHKMGKKVYVTVNIIAKDEDFENLEEYLKFLKSIDVDAIIVADIGVLAFSKRVVPDLEVHISTQANIINTESALLMANLGAKRIVLARELTLKQIEKIKNSLPKDVEIEVFVHGAMCMAYSGRCLLSNYLTGRDSNRGECVQACRWKYYVREEASSEEMEVEEDEKGCYIFNSRDLNMLEHLEKLKEIGVDSVKIEGRMKSPFYVATVVNAYRQALDNLPKKPSKVLIEELEKTSHRPYTTGFYFGDKNLQYILDSTPVQQSEFVAIIEEDCSCGRVLVEMRNKFSLGEELEILSPDKEIFNKKLVVKNITNLNGESLTEVKNVQQKVYIDCNFPLKAGDILRR